MSASAPIAQSVRALVRLPMSRVSWKICLPFIALSLFVAAAGTYIATRLVTASLQDRFDNQLAEAARVMSDATVRQERANLAVVRGISFTDGMPAMVTSGNPEAVDALAEPVAANANAEFVEIVGRDGQRILGLHRSQATGKVYERMTDAGDRTSWALVSGILSGKKDQTGDKFSQMVQVPQGIVMYTAGPIMDGDRVVGAVLVGTTVQSFLTAAKQQALADITIYDFKGQPLATTFNSVSDSEANLTPTGSGDINGRREVKQLYGRSYDLLYGELRIRNQAVGLFSIALPSSFISSAGSTTRLLMAGLFGAATIAVLLIGLFTARGVTQPLVRLVRTARAVTSGDLTARSGLHSVDEMGTLASSIDIMTARLADQHLSTIRALTSAIDARDPYTAGHSIRVGQLAMEMGRWLELPKRDLQFLEIGGYLHDVGKIGIRDDVLLKPGGLTPEERKMIEDHPTIGLKIIQYVDLPDEVRQFVGQHHEKLNGSGYPDGLDARSLTMFPRIGAVADMYDAITTKRPYKPALNVSQAVDMLKYDSAQGLLDPLVIHALIAVLPTWGRRLQLEPELQGFHIRDFADERVTAS